MPDVTTGGPLDPTCGPPRSRTTPNPLAVPTASHRETWDPANGTAHRDTRRGDHFPPARTPRLRPGPNCAPPAAMRYHRDGDREEYETALRARQLRLTRAVIAAASTLDARRGSTKSPTASYLLCEQSTWCWPAHDDARASTGALPARRRPTLPRPWRGRGWQPSSPGRTTSWANNWTSRRLGSGPACAGRCGPASPRPSSSATTGTGSARRTTSTTGTRGFSATSSPRPPSSRTTTRRDARSSAWRSPRSTPTSARLPLDGAIDEGYSYWWNGACRLLETIDISTPSWGGFDAGSVPALRATVDFPHQMHLGGDWFVAVGDGQARPPSDLPWHSLFAAARRMGADAARRFAVSRRPASGMVATETGGTWPTASRPRRHRVGGRIGRARAAAARRLASLHARSGWRAQSDGSSEGLTAVLKGGQQRRAPQPSRRGLGHRRARRGASHR